MKYVRKKEEKRNRQWTSELGQLAKKQGLNCHSRPLQLGSSFIPLFYDIFISGTQSQGYWGGGGALVPPNFSRGKMFLFNKYQVHAVSQVPVILHLIQVEIFREISHWECCKCHVRASTFQNFLWEDTPRPPPPCKIWSSLVNQDWCYSPIHLLLFLRINQNFSDQKLILCMYNLTKNLM